MTHNLQLDRLALEFDGPDLEVDADGGDVGFGVGVVCETEEEAGFADAGIADEEELCRSWSESGSGSGVTEDEASVRVGWVNEGNEWRNGMY